MTEPQDVLAPKPLRPTTNAGRMMLAAGLTFHSGRRLADYPETIIAVEQEAAERAALVRTPETLDVERLARALARYHRMPQWSCTVAHYDGYGLPIPCPDGPRTEAATIAREYAALASPAPDPGAGLREALDEFVPHITFGLVARADHRVTHANDPDLLADIEANCVRCKLDAALHPSEEGAE